jgi:hypothetical protein
MEIVVGKEINMKSFVPAVRTSPRRSLTCLVAIVLALSVAPSRPQSFATPASPIEPVPLKLHHVVDVVGMGDFNHRSGGGISLGPTGTLELDDRRMTFLAGDSTTVLPLQSIRAFAIAHDNVALIGNAGADRRALGPLRMKIVFTSYEQATWV